MSEIYLLFVQSALQTFICFNKFLQSKYPLVPILYRQIQSFLNKQVSKFLQISSIKAAKGDLFVLKYKESDRQLPGSEINVL